MRIQILTVLLLLVAIVHGIVRFGMVPATMNNVAIALGHIFIIQGFIRYAWRPQASKINTTDIFEKQPHAAAPAAPVATEGESAS